jgi:hypothetical protein
MEEEWPDRSPFPDYRNPGLFLLIVIGGGMLASAGLALIGSVRQVGCVRDGDGVALWLIIETAIVGFQAWEQYVLLVVCGVVALILLGVGARSFWGSGCEPASER